MQAKMEEMERAAQDAKQREGDLPKISILKNSVTTEKSSTAQKAQEEDPEVVVSP